MLIGVLVVFQTDAGTGQPPAELGSELLATGVILWATRGCS